MNTFTPPPPPWLQAARDQWTWRGQARPHAWSYSQPLADAQVLAECVAFYARGLSCSVGGLPATPQPGGFYGGWVTPDLAGPFKGEPGSEGW